MAQTAKIAPSALPAPSAVTAPALSAPKVPSSTPESPPPWLLALVMLVYGIVWVLGYQAVTLSPPVDNVEQLIWLQSLQWGYYKHPPLPTWLLATAAQFLPPNPGLTYALGAVTHLASMAVMWRLLRPMCGKAFAALALLAVLCISLYSGRLYYYNHNVLMMLWVALTVWLSWQVTLRPSLHLWMALGLVAGLGMLTKYQFVLAVAMVGLWWLQLRGWAYPIHRWGAVLAGVIALAIFAPHLAWLMSHDWMPMAYAQSSALGHDLPPVKRITHALQFVADWLLNRCLPAFLVLGAAAWAMRKSGLAMAVPTAPSTASPTTPSTDRASAQQVRRFLCLWGFGPLLLMAAMAVLGGSKLHLHWGTAFMLWSVPAVMQCWQPRGLWGQRVPPAAWGAFVLVQALLLGQAWMASPQGLRGYKADHSDFFPAQAVAAQIAAQAPAVIGGPVELITGPQELAQAIAIALPQTPRVLIEGPLERSPWLEPEDLRQLRAIEVLYLRPDTPAPEDAHPIQGRWAWRSGLGR